MKKWYVGIMKKKPYTLAGAVPHVLTKLVHTGMPKHKKFKKAFSKMYGTFDSKAEAVSFNASQGWHYMGEWYDIEERNPGESWHLQKSKALMDMSRRARDFGSEAIAKEHKIRSDEHHDSAFFSRRIGMKNPNPLSYKVGKNIWYLSRQGGRFKLENRTTGVIDYPVIYHDKTIGYERPEILPKSLKRWVQIMLSHSVGHTLKNPVSIPERVLAWRERFRRGTIMRPKTFKKIKRGAARRGYRKPAAAGGKAYWITLLSKYLDTHPGDVGVKRIYNKLLASRRGARNPKYKGAYKYFIGIMNKTPKVGYLEVLSKGAYPTRRVFPMYDNMIGEFDSLTGLKRFADMNKLTIKPSAKIGKVANPVKNGYRGKLGDFGAYGKLYIVYPIDNNFWVTDLHPREWKEYGEAVPGWYIRQAYLKKIIRGNPRCVTGVKKNFPVKPSEYFNLPVIGTIIVSNIDGTESTHDVILYDKSRGIFTVDKWYKEYKKVPQLIPGEFVKLYTPKNRGNPVLETAAAVALGVTAGEVGKHMLKKSGILKNPKHVIYNVIYSGKNNIKRTLTYKSHAKAISAMRDLKDKGFKIHGMRVTGGIARNPRSAKKMIESWKKKKEAKGDLKPTTEVYVGKRGSYYSLHVDRHGYPDNTGYIFLPMEGGGIHLMSFQWGDRNFQFYIAGKSLGRYPNRMKKNPSLKGAVEIYDNILAIEAQKGSKSLFPDENFRHDFKKSKGKASVFGMPDGSLVIKGNKRLWKEFDYD